MLEHNVDLIALAVVSYILVATMLFLWRTAPREMVRATKAVVFFAILSGILITARLVLRLAGYSLSPVALANLYLASLMLTVIALLHWASAVTRIFKMNDYLAHTDSLTGLSNRAGLERALAGVMDAELQGNLALLYMDLDGFKAINDTLGHEAGDRVLQQVSTILYKELREHDVVARVGGDEFIAVVPGATAERANKIAERIKARVGQLYESEQLDLSIGIAVCPQDACHIPELKRIADERMYSQKRAAQELMAAIRV